MKICILAAGVGSRMDDLTKNLNKVLLPIHSNAVLSHILNQFPKDSSFVIAVGYGAEKVKEYCSLAHVDLKIQFVSISPYEGQGSGPGLSLYQCRPFLNEPFVLVCGDTIWNKPWMGEETFSKSWVGVAPVNKTQAHQYCLIESKDQLVTAIKDKEALSVENPMAFIGLFFIKDFALFFKGLESEKEILGERQLSSGLKLLQENNLLFTKEIISWQDVGQAHLYRELNKDCPNYLFKKENELFFHTNQSIIKYHSDPVVVNQRVNRAKTLKGIVPELSGVTKHFVKYDYVEGETLDQVIDIKKFSLFLNWLEEKLWINSQSKNASMFNTCDNFYRLRAIGRWDNLRKKDKTLFEPSTVNGLNMVGFNDLEKKINWSFIENYQMNHFHGDLLLNNVLYCKHKDPFLLIDWRHNFSDQVEFGDIRYDFAKILLNLEVDFFKIKKGFYSFKKEGNDFKIQIEALVTDATYKEILKEKVKEMRIQWEEIELIKNLILLNIAPLHSNELSQIFWKLGMYNVNKSLNP